MVKGQEPEVVDGRLVHLGDSGQGVKRQRVHLGHSGHGVSRQRVHLGNNGEGVKRQRVHLGDSGHGVNRKRSLVPWFQALSDRLTRVRVCSGDWSRVCGPSVTFKQGMTAVFLDPPYADTAGRHPSRYRRDSASVAHDVREWAIEAGKRPDMRVGLAGYEGEHTMPAEWAVHEWTAPSGYSSHGDGSNVNRERERIWFSPACLPVNDQLSLFDLPAARAVEGRPI
jgi:hypothetical protein